MAEKLCSIPHHSLDDDMDHDGGSLFVLRSDDLQRQYLTLSTKIAGRTVESRTKAVATVMAKLRKDGVITGWRDEQFQVSATYYSDPLFLIERSATNILGVLDYGVHINGLVRQQTSPEAPPKMWIGRRSATKSKFPGMLDHLVAGGQPANLGLMENCLKECEEEAGVPPELVKAGIHPVGAISYQNWDPRSDKISRVVLFNYDLYLPESFKPKPVDGEVEEFVLWDIDQVKASMALDYPDPIKPNCYVVIIDYLLRQGYINPEVEGYLDILRELRSGECQ